MMNILNNWPQGGLGIEAMGGGLVIFAVLLIWVMVWKGLALWHAARRGEKVWFVILLLVNTLGILEIIYLLAVVKIHRKKSGFHATASEIPEQN
jgi:UDP-N-acetylmuramyl pentapeptide phosphotransferase/UDP-N-acetylglucosamine-1-phosphate transferase